MWAIVDDVAVQRGQPVSLLNLFNGAGNLSKCPFAMLLPLQVDPEMVEHISEFFWWSHSNRPKLTESKYFFFQMACVMRCAGAHQWLQNEIQPHFYFWVVTWPSRFKTKPSWSWKSTPAPFPNHSSTVWRCTFSRLANSMKSSFNALNNLINAPESWACVLISGKFFVMN